MAPQENNHRIGELERRVEDLESIIKGSSGRPGIESNQLLIMNHLYNPNDGLLKEFKKMRDTDLKRTGFLAALIVLAEMVGWWLKK